MKKRSLIIITSILMLTMVAIFSGCSGNKVELKLNLEKGDHFQFTQKTEQQVIQEFFGSEKKSVQNTLMKYEYIVMDTDQAGNYLIDLEYKSFQVEFSNARETVKFSTDNPGDDPPPFSIIYSSIIGQVLRLNVTQTGEILEIKGLDELHEKIIDSIKESNKDIPMENLARLRLQIETEFGEETIKQNMKFMSGFFPDKPVKPGESWNKQFYMTKLIPVSINSTYTLKEAGTETNDIQFTSKIETYRGPDAEPGSPEIKYKMTGTQEGMIKLMKTKGLVKHSEITQTMKGSVEGNGMSIPMNIKTEFTSKCKIIK